MRRCSNERGKHTRNVRGCGRQTDRPACTPQRNPTLSYQCVVLCYVMLCCVVSLYGHPHVVVWSGLVGSATGEESKGRLGPERDAGGALVWSLEVRRADMYIGNTVELFETPRLTHLYGADSATTSAISTPGFCQVTLLQVSGVRLISPDSFAPVLCCHDQTPTLGKWCSLQHSCCTK
jgi:hypothetical protein